MIKMKKRLLSIISASTALCLSYSSINAQEQEWRAFDSFVEEADANNIESQNTDSQNLESQRRQRRTNHSPVAIINYDIGDEFSEIVEDESMFFLPVAVDACDSYDPDEDDLEYLWEINYNGEVSALEGISFNIMVPLKEGENELSVHLTVRDVPYRGEQLEDIDDFVFSYYLERESHIEYIMVDIEPSAELGEGFTEASEEKNRLYIFGNFGYIREFYMFDSFVNEEIDEIGIKMLSFNLGALIDYLAMPLFFELDYSTTIHSEEGDFEVKNSSIFDFVFGTGYLNDNILLTTGLRLNNYNFNFSDELINESINDTSIGAEANFIADLERVIISLSGSLHENGYNYNGDIGIRLTSSDALGLLIMSGFNDVNNNLQNYYSIPIGLCLSGGSILSTNANLCLGASINLNSDELLFNNFNVGFGSYNGL